MHDWQRSNGMRLPAILSCILLWLTPGCEKTEAENLATNPEPPAEQARNFKVIHVYVALCDNESQGIAPVPQRIGDGDDPATNLYWGCSDGAKPVFSKSKQWSRLSSGKAKGNPAILERLVFQHKRTKALVVIDAWRGSKIESCIREFCQAVAGQHYESLALPGKNDGGKKVNIAGGADMAVFIGHNGLMEFNVPALAANPNRKQNVDAMVLCCRSKAYFDERIRESGARPVLLTASNMYPGAFILHDALEGWFRKESPDKLRLRAAKAYAKNQRISTKSALNVFAPLP